jgi:hypothetical protein
MPKDLGVDSSTFSGENEGAVISGVALPDTCTLNLDHSPHLGNNSLSSIAAAQLLMRLVLHRELPITARFPLLQWSDIQELLYGAGERSRLFPGEEWGGMSADTGRCSAKFNAENMFSRISLARLQPFFFRTHWIHCYRWTILMPPLTASGEFSASLATVSATVVMSSKCSTQATFAYLQSRP